ncbi:lysM and putative peptidoglycan-binding domain-containing protein 4 [Brachionichthys hirsutus]|uniref:lysM and putative peptidoglycan-binding domain-containing protein 4 n=1 Tax=Brachionichthys hirsutus TaxID=412623 RepID=UPI003604512C
MRRGENAPRAFLAPVDVHASADGKVYMFKRSPNESAASSDDEEFDVFEMAPRVYREQERDKLKHVQILEREVFDGDNLNKLALQYGCKVADMKRVNNLMQEQDFFALKSIKIPVQKHSFLTETRADPSEPQEETARPAAMATKPRDRARAHPHVEEVTDFLMEVDNDIEKLIQTTDDQDAALANSEEQKRFGSSGRGLGGHGADWGIQWWNAVVAMLLIGIVLPLFYVIYFKTKGNGGVPPTDHANASQATGFSLNASGADRPAR